MSEQETNNSATTENSNDVGGQQGGQTTVQEPPANPSPESKPNEGGESSGESTLLGGAKTGEEEASKEGEEKPEEKKEGEEPKGAPESYEDFTAPEGMEFDSGVIEAFKGVAKDLNLSQETAQDFLNKMAPVIAERQVERIKAVSNEWAEKSRSDKEIGGDNFKRSMADIARLRDRFAVNEDGKIDPDIEDFMNTPIGNHPGCLKLLARAGRAFGEGGFPRGAEARSTEMTADDIYS